jgi:hypothetical protein
MKYTDLIAHLNKIQDAMWKTIPGNVSVFIGSGFSRNSSPIDACNKSFPDWTQLSTAMIDELYPADSISDEERKKLIIKAEVPAQILRFAQEYKELFGQVKLDDLLKKNIPDDKYEPSELYYRLLELPWKDVFTTNYDTLIERANYNKKYLIITKIQDLAGSYSPRIIKLHGSFPNTTPFIITEEEFRNYPKNYKPFINTVQQSLIENLFILIGFSGDDPNFQSWIGWVRDNMHDYTQKIYICTLASLTEYTEAQKRSLNKKNIEILDLSLIFKEKSSGYYDKEPNYPEAFKWLFEYLKTGIKVNPLNWPTEFLPSLPPRSILIDSPDKVDKEKLRNKKINQALDKYLINIRETSPGWIITPEKNRNSIAYDLSHYNLKEIIKACENDSTTIRILANYLWVYHIKYISLDYFQVSVIHSYIKILEEDKGRLNSILVNSSDSKHLIELICYMISDARETKDTESIDYYFKLVESFKTNDPFQKQKYHYEKLMCILYRLNIQEINTTLAEWLVDIKYPLYCLLKASLLCELGKLKEASDLVSNVLESIRQNREKNISNKSVEGVCLYILDILNRGNRINDKNGFYENPWERLQNLEMERCNPYSEITRLKLNVNKGISSRKPSVERKKLFEPFNYKTIHYLTAETTDNGARCIINFYDYMPIPITSNNVITIDKETILNAVQTFKHSQPLYAIPFLMRYQSTDLIEEILTRFYIGIIDQKSFNYLFETYYLSLIDNINFINSNKYDRTLSSIISCQIEFLSRLIFRTTEEQYNLIIELIKRIYSSMKLVNDWGISRLKKNLIHRTLDHRSFFLGKKLEVFQYFFNLPLPDAETLKNSRYEYPEPWDELTVESIHIFDKLVISDDNIRQLLNYASYRDESIRSFALMRLYFYYEIKKLKSDHIEEFKKNLWCMTDESRLPENTGLRTWVILNMPYPEDADVKNLVKQYLINIDFKRHMLTSTSIGGRRNSLIEKISDIIDVTQNVLRFKRNIDYIEFNHKELREFLEIIINSWQSIRENIEDNINKSREEFRDELKTNYQFIADLLAIIILPNLKDITFVEKQELYEMVMILEKNYI